MEMPKRQRTGALQDVADCGHALETKSAPRLYGIGDGGFADYCGSADVLRSPSRSNGCVNIARSPAGVCGQFSFGRSQ